MSTRLTMQGHRASRPASCAEAAQVVTDWMGRIGSSLPKNKRWLALDRSFDRVPIRNSKVLEKLFRLSPPGRKDERASRPAAYDATLFCLVGNVEVVRAVVQFSTMDEPSGKADFFFSADIGGPGVGPAFEMASRAQSLLADMGHVFRFRSATCSVPGSLKRLRLGPQVPRVGWLTYLSRSLGPLPIIPPPTHVAPVGDLGWILIAQQEPVDPTNPEHQASLAYVRHALGARVLLDGPSFPPPMAVEKLPEPEVVSPAPAATPQVPSYLHAPSVSPVRSPLPIAPALVAPVPAPQSPVPVLPPVSAAMPYPTETGDVDISKILKGPLPFDAKAAPVLPVGAPAAKASPVGFGGTEEFDLAVLLKAAPSVPFERPAQSTQSTQPTQSAKTTALPAAPASPAPSSTHGRWIRFNPQTGEPLATPYWEELPATDRK